MFFKNVWYVAACDHEITGLNRLTLHTGWLYVAKLQLRIMIWRLSYFAAAGWSKVITTLMPATYQNLIRY